MIEVEVLREIYRIVEWRDGAIFKTEYVEDKWVPMDEVPPQGSGLLYVVKNDPDLTTIRVKKE